MELSEQKINGTNEIHITDALNTALLKLKLKVGDNTTIPDTTNLMIYVDNNPSTNPTTNRKEYIFPLSEPLKAQDEFKIETKIINNEIILTTTLNNQIQKSNPIILLEGENYIYTNYQNIIIELVYPQNNDLNNYLVNTALYATNSYPEVRMNEEIPTYIKDAFTKTADNLNLQVDNLKIDCLTSHNNTFSLDKDGNLIVNSIQTVEKEETSIDDIDLLNKIYPVGSIYLTVNETSPSILFGGTWTRWGNGRVPAGVDSVQSEFSTVEKTGGEKIHTLTTAEMPKHNHILKLQSGNISGGTGQLSWGAGGQCQLWYNDTPGTGDNQPHNNLQPYITCYMWKRTA